MTHRVLRAAAALTISMIRGKAAVPVLIALVIPSAISTILSITHQALINQSSTITSHYVEGTGTVVSSRPINGLKCVNALLIIGNLSANGEELTVPVYVTNDTIKFLRLTGSAVIGRLKKKVNALNASLSIELARRLKLRLGSRISICFNSSCINAVVTCIHRGRGLNTYSVVINSPPVKGERIYACLVNRSVIIGKLIKGVNQGLGSVTSALIAATLTAYVLVSYLAYVRAASLTKEEIRSMHACGLPRNELIKAFTVAGVLVGAISLTVGISLGTVAAHAGLWLLRFIGKAVISRPPPSLNYLMMAVPTYLLLAAISSYAAVKREVVGWG